MPHWVPAVIGDLLRPGCCRCRRCTVAGGARPTRPRGGPAARCVAALPSPLVPPVPAELPATVYMSLAVIDWPHCVPCRSPRPPGSGCCPRRRCTGRPGRAERQARRVHPGMRGRPPRRPRRARTCPACPAIVYTSPAVIEMPHWVPDATGISTTRLLPVSAMYRSPAESNARPCRLVSSGPRPVPFAESLPRRCTARDRVHVPGRHRMPHCVPDVPGSPRPGSRRCRRCRCSRRCTRTPAGLSSAARRRRPALPGIGAQPVQRVDVARHRPGRRSATTPSCRSTRTPSRPGVPVWVCCCATCAS